MVTILGFSRGRSGWPSIVPPTNQTPGFLIETVVRSDLCAIAALKRASKCSCTPMYTALFRPFSPCSHAKLISGQRSLIIKNSVYPAGAAHRKGGHSTDFGHNVKSTPGLIHGHREPSHPLQIDFAPRTMRKPPAGIPDRGRNACIVRLSDLRMDSRSHPVRSPHRRCGR